MMNMRLGKRLTAVVDEVEGKSLADVGCDHGKVSVACLLSGKVEKVIACDISQKSLQKAMNLAKQLQLGGIEFRVGNGLRVIKDDEADCVVIAGMGGKEIMSILSRIPQGVKRLVLSPHRNAIELRRYLSKKGIYIVKDYIIKDGAKFYDVIVAEIDSERDCTLERRQLLLGMNKIGGDFDEYLVYLQNKYDVIAQKSSLSKQANLYAEMLELAKQI